MNIDGFMAALTARTHSQQTLRAYRQDLSKFEQFLAARNLRVTQVRTQTISDYVQHMKDTAGRTASGTLAPASIARRLTVLSSYYAFLRAESNGKVKNPFERYKRPDVSNDRPRAVDEEAVNSLLTGIDNLRDKAIFMLFLFSGLRLSELCQLNLDSIQIRTVELPSGVTLSLGEGEVLGKGNKRRRFVVALEAVTALAQYLQTRTSLTEPAMFLSERGSRLSGRAVQHLVHKWCVKLGVGRIHVHQLRHSFATRMVNAGMSSAVLRDLMGHSSFTTTQRYFRIRPERLATEYFAAMEFINAE
jgi:site-specific recombinase XerD